MNEPFYVGDWLVEPMTNRISRDTQTARVEPKVMGVLTMLSRRPGDVVTREELFDEVWAGTVVTDDVLTRSVSELRKVFGDDVKRQDYIETIPKTGYRLVAPVSFAPSIRSRSDSPYQTATKVRRVAESHATGVHVSPLGLAALVVVLVLALVWSIESDPEDAGSPLYPVPVTTYPGRESAPRLSPDGKRVAFSWRGEGQDNVDVYVKYIDAAPVLRLTDGAAYEANPAWSPDGTEIAYMSRDQECQVRIVTAIGGRSRVAGSCGASIYGDLTWSPDGAWLAFNDKLNPAESYAIYLMSPITGEKHELTSPPTGIWGDHDPVFSPNGDRISFVRSVSEGMQDVYVIDVSGAEERRLTFEYRNIWGSAWLPGGHEIVVASNRTGRPGLWKVNASGGVLRWMGVQAPAAVFPSVAGDRLAFLQMDADVNLWRAPLGHEGGFRPFASSTYWDLHPAISPDGSQVAFASNRSGSYEIWIADSAGNSLRQLTHFGGPFTSTPRWSPDGTMLAFASRPEGNADIYVFKLNSPSPRRITTDPSDDLAPDWSFDGREILYTSNRSGTWETWQIPADGGSSDQITHSGTFGARPLMDEESIGFSRTSEPGIWRLDERSGKETEILTGTDPRDWGSWKRAGSGLYFIHRGSPILILRQDVSTGVVDTVLKAPGRVPAMDPALDVSPDERWLILGQIDREEGDIMEVELGMSDE